MEQEARTISCRGVQFPLDSTVITPQIARKLRKGFYETNEILVLAKLLKPGARILELGAGLGFVSTYALKECGAAQVTCVEANPVLCDYIARVHAANGIGNAHIINGAALPASAPDTSTLPFFVADPFWSSSLFETNNASAQRIDVPALRLDELIEYAQPDVLICDIEGGEADLFEDAALSGVRHVVMELHTRVYGGDGILRTFSHMHAQGFFYHQKLSGGDVVVFERLQSADADSGSISPAARMA